MKKTTVLGSYAACLGAAGCLALACGGSTVDITATDAASGDGSTGGGDASAGDSTLPSSEAGPDGAPAATDAPPGDAGPPCAPPADSTKAALCISFTHDALDFLAADPSFDGKGLLAVDVHDTPNPDAPDGGSLPALSGAVFPSSDGGDAGEIDLSATLPAVRFDGLPAGAVYPRAIFLDSRDTQKVGAGWWLGGYDLTGGLQTHNLLLPVTLTAGTGTAITLDLTALRGIGVTLTRSVTPLGNGQGPGTVIFTPSALPNDASTFFGVASNPCVNLAADDASALVTGFVLGSGPYYAFGVLDDFVADAALALPPGALTSLAQVDGSIVNPSSSQVQYAPGAYVVTKILDLDLVVPFPDGGPDGGADADPVTCP